MTARGPDSAGEWSDSPAGLCLGHSRLSIIDLSARADQPFVSSDGRHVIVFNGEIYNYRKLGAELEAHGVRLRTTSDTEVVLELYRRDGVRAFSQLRGMFALAIWDTVDRALILARDPYGIKPLYMAHTAAGFLFASQVKAVLASGLTSCEIDNAGVAGFFIWGSVPEPFSLYRDIRAVPAGSYVAVNAEGDSSTTQYVDIRSAWRAQEPVIGDLGDHVRSAMESTVRAHMVADVPVAVLLSGGVDSGAIAGLMAEGGQDVEGVTISFEEFAESGRDEVPRAAAIARTYGLRHTVRTVTKTEFQDDIPSILAAMDQPSIDGVNTWFASKAIAERGYKVALSGIGGDELLAGYDTFRTAPRLRRVGRILEAMGPARRLAPPLFSLAARALQKPKVAAIPTLSTTLAGAYMLRRALLTPSELGYVMSADDKRDGLERLASSGGDERAELSSVASVAILESTRYLRNQLLRDADWASMAHSLELRTPLVDFELLTALAPLAERFTSGAGKALLANAPRKPLPAEVTAHRKTGFGLPIAEWLDTSRAPAGMRTPWARNWACTVAQAFDIAL